DSYGVRTPDKGDCGALYGQYAPTVNASKPPATWQTFDITFRAPKVSANGEILQNGRMTMVHNGIKVLDDVELRSLSGGALNSDRGRPGPVLLQDHSSKVRFRNIWLKPLSGE